MSKNNKQTIDETSFLAAIRANKEEYPSQQNTNPQLEPQQENQQQPIADKKKKQKSDSYIDTYLQVSDESARMGKAMTIRQEYHELLSKFLQVVTQNKVSLFSYIDNVLIEHFKQNQEEINRLYQENFKDLFNK